MFCNKLDTKWPVGNIFWNRDVLSKREHGAIDIGLRSPRRLQWVRLAMNDGSTEMLVSTAHFPWVGGKDEIETGLNPRAAITRTVVECLDQLKSKLEMVCQDSTKNEVVSDQDPLVFFMGDLNEAYVPARIMRGGGYQDCFTALGLPNIPTHPARPSSAREENLPDRVLDWIFASTHARPVLANVLRNCFYGGRLHPSDHFPVMAVYDVGSASKARGRQQPHSLVFHELPYAGAY
jgi:endonuclease/exonuclease/phosphatase family metal-dependent hydrolase